MVNSNNPANDRVTLRSHYSCHKASQKPQSQSEHPVVSNFFRRPPFRPTSTPIGASLSDLHSSGSLTEKHLSTRRRASIFSPELKFTWWRVRYYLATRLLQHCRLPPPPSLSSHSMHPVVVRKSLIFHFFSPMTISELLCCLNLLSFCVFRSSTTPSGP